MDWREGVGEEDDEGNLVVIDVVEDGVIDGEGEGLQAPITPIPPIIINISKNQLRILSPFQPKFE